MIITPVTIPAMPIATFMFPTVMIEATAIKVSPVVPFEIGPVVGEIYPVMIVAVPGRIVIVSIAGVFGLALGGWCIVAAVIFRDGSRSGRIGVTVNYGRGSGNNHPGTGYMKADAGAYIDLGIAFGSDEAGGYNGGEDEYLFHICSF